MIGKLEDLVTSAERESPLPGEARCIILMKDYMNFAQYVQKQVKNSWSADFGSFWHHCSDKAIMLYWKHVKYDIKYVLMNHRQLAVNNLHYLLIVVSNFPYEW